MVQFAELIDPELLPPLEALIAFAGPGGFAAIADLDRRRQVLSDLSEAAAAADTEDLGVTSADEDADGVPVRVYVPSADSSAPLPVILAMHGGGMVAGTIADEEPFCRMLAAQVSAVVVSVGYRLAPEHPAPAAVEDCYRALAWSVAGAEQLGIDPSRTALFGRSAGGGLAAALALMIRDRSELPSPALQMLLYPMLDDRCDTPSAQAFTDVGVWDRAPNLEAWHWYLGERYGTDDVTPYDAPARAESLAGLPPAFLDVGTVDVFRDEVVQYAARLLAAGVPSELHVWPGVYHAAEKFAPAARVAQQMWKTRLAALRVALNG